MFRGRNVFRLLALLVAVVCLHPCSAGKRPATVLEASFKERITAELNASVEAGVAHLVVRLGLGSGIFGGYELEMVDPTGNGDYKEAAVAWHHSCTDVVISRDSVENCALRQLQALTALCDANGYTNRESKGNALVLRHLKALDAKEVATLGIQRTKFDDAEIWFHRRLPDGSPADVDASPTLQASALSTMVRCAAVTGERQYFEDAEALFRGLRRVFPERVWLESHSLTYHKLSIIWESLALVATHLPRDSTFLAELLKYLTPFENFLRAQWDKDSNIWSFSSASALGIRWHSGLLRAKRQRASMRRWAREHAERFLGTRRRSQQEGELVDGILARIGGEGYTCGPLQGLSALSSILGDAKLVGAILQLLQKDVRTYQMRGPDFGPFAPTEEMRLEVVGAFFRDARQLKMEERKSLRVDDVAQCITSLTQMLRVLDGIQGVVLPNEAVDGDTEQTKGPAVDSSEGTQGAGAPAPPAEQPSDEL